MSTTTDPWSNITSADLQLKLESHFIEDSELSTAGGIVYWPDAEVSIRAVLAELLQEQEQKQVVVEAAQDSELEEDEDEDEDELYEDDPLEDPIDVLTKIAGTKTSWLVTCGNPSSHVSGIWGLCKFSIGNRGYVYHSPDFGIGADESLELLGAWQPLDNHEAYSACFLDLYSRCWRWAGFPPFLGEKAKGPPELMKAAIYAALGELEDDDNVWEGIVEVLEKAHKDGTLTATVLEQCRAQTQPPVATTARLLLSFQNSDFTGLGQMQLHKLTQSERRLVVELFWSCIEGEP